MRPAQFPHNVNTGTKDMMKHPHPWIVLLFAVWVLMAEHPAQAQNLTGPVVLTVDGSISRADGAAIVKFDMAMLAALPSHVIKTQTPWTEGIQTFAGPLVADVLKAAGATGTNFRAVAINDYGVDIPMVDITSYPVILAITHNDKKMSVRTKGPLWIIYPWGDNSAIRNEKYYNRSIWQLRKITVE